MGAMVSKYIDRFVNPMAGLPNQVSLKREPPKEEQSKKEPPPNWPPPNWPPHVPHPQVSPQTDPDLPPLILPQSSGDPYIYANMHIPEGYYYKRSKKPPNPGTYANMHYKCTELFPEPFGGAKLFYNRCMNDQFQVTHGLELSNAINSGYNFGVTYVGSKVVGPNDGYPVLSGVMTPRGQLNATIVHQLADRLRCKFSAVCGSAHEDTAQLKLDYHEDLFSAALILANPSLRKGRGSVIGQYLYAMTPYVAWGLEVCMHMSPDGSFWQSTTGIQYTDREKDLIVSGLIGSNGLHLSCYKRVNAVLETGVELHNKDFTKDTLATFGYKYTMPDWGTIFRASIDSQYNFIATMEKRMTPMAMIFVLSAHYDFRADKIRMGGSVVIN